MVSEALVLSLVLMASSAQAKQQETLLIVDAPPYPSVIRMPTMIACKTAAQNQRGRVICVTKDGTLIWTKPR